MRAKSSLIRRMLIASIALLPLLLSFSAYMLNRAYSTSLDESEAETLNAQLYALMAVADIDDEGLQLPGIMANPNFETPESGLYAQVRDAENEVVWQSNSLSISTESLEFPSQAPSVEAGTQIFFDIPYKAHAHKVLRYGTIWEFDDKEFPYTFEVIQSQAQKRANIASYQRTLFFWLGGMAILLIAVQLTIVRWGLRPLSKLASEINEIEKGGQKTLNGAYPAELNPVTQSLNKLIQSEQSQRERYKNSLADLAHSLKTPLTVMRSLLDKTEKNTEDALLDDQIERMSSIVSHQLKRASAQVRAVYQQQNSVSKVVERLGLALAKVYQDKNIQFRNEVADDILSIVEEDDLMEMLGNIVENAFKYGRKAVWVNAQKTGTEITICVSDDGEGVPDALRTQILGRGARADTSKIGQGIGLAIAVDILSSYNGALDVGKSDAAGAEFKITLPIK